MNEAQNATPLVQITGVCKWYGDFSALFNIDLNVATGEKVVICGPSGSGTETLSFAAAARRGLFYRPTRCYDKALAYRIRHHRLDC